MAGAHSLQNNEMLRRMQLEHLERQRHWIQQQPPEKCPRCSSMDTKFCYFNNFSADQPRYFCNACGRHWTKGGRLRNIPVGGSVRPAPSTRFDVAVNQLHGYFVRNPPGPSPLALMMTRSARALAFPPPVLVLRPAGTGWQTEPENVFLFHQFRPVYHLVDGFWHGPFYRTSTGPLP